jgi:hypothetical protein
MKARNKMLKHETDKTLNELIERAKERQEKWNTVTVRELPDPFTLKEVTFLGSMISQGLFSKICHS